jgi:hypothetical protein
MSRTPTVSERVRGRAALAPEDREGAKRGGRALLPRGHEVAREAAAL